MKNKIKALLRSFISPSLRFEINEKRGRFKKILSGMCFWKWKSYRFTLSTSNPTVVHFVGRPENKAALMALLGSNPNGSEDFSRQTVNSKFRALATEFPTRDSICLPFCLSTIVRLGRTSEEIMATYAKSLRRSINGQRKEFRYEQVKELTKIYSIERNMLWAYANARHDLSASQLHPDVVKKLALSDFGCLDVLVKGEEEVGCHLGNAYVRKGKHYWHVNRLGYPETIFSDYKLWGEINSMNLHLALESAIEKGFDYCDYGISLAKPGAGLIEWKRRRKGFLATYGNHQYLYLKLPEYGTAQFLWDAPLFAVESGKITLHLGIPEGKTDEEILEHYHEMGYGGLYKVYLQCIKPPSDHVLETIRGLYEGNDPSPLIITYVVK